MGDAAAFVNERRASATAALEQEVAVTLSKLGALIGDLRSGAYDDAAAKVGFLLAAL